MYYISGYVLNALHIDKTEVSDGMEWYDMNGDDLYECMVSNLLQSIMIDQTSNQYFETEDLENLREISEKIAATHLTFF